MAGSTVPHQSKHNRIERTSLLGAGLNSPLRFFPLQFSPVQIQPKSLPHMKTLNQYSLTVYSSATIVFGLIFSALCFAAEFKKPKINDLRLDGKLCYLPGSSAFELGIGSLICLCFAQTLGNLFVCRKRLQSRKRLNRVWKPSISCILLVFSWSSFGLVATLISVATSMSRNQDFGEGWLNGECYLVKNGVYIGSSFLGLLALGSTIWSGVLVMRQLQAEENKMNEEGKRAPTPEL